MARNEARTPDAPRVVYRCISGFATPTGSDGVPPVWGYGDEVFEDHPILKTVHRQNFEPIHDRVLRREQAITSASGVVPPTIDTNEQENPTNARV